jgi:hypothetical protein
MPWFVIDRLHKRKDELVPPGGREPQSQPEALMDSHPGAEGDPAEGEVVKMSANEGRREISVLRPADGKCCAFSAEIS